MTLSSTVNAMDTLSILLLIHFSFNSLILVRFHVLDYTAFRALTLLVAS